MRSGVSVHEHVHDGASTNGGTPKENPLYRIATVEGVRVARTERLYV